MTAFTPEVKCLCAVRLKRIVRTVIDPHKVCNHLLKVQLSLLGKHIGVAQVLAVVTHPAERKKPGEPLNMVLIVILPDFMTVHRRIAGVAGATSVVVVLVDLPA